MILQAIVLLVCVACRSADALSHEHRHQLIHHTAHDVAQAMCPFPLTQQYGCPIDSASRHHPSTKSTQDLRSKLMKEHAVVEPDGFFSSSSRSSATNSTTSPLAFFNPGSVPVGIGFDITTQSVRLPYFYPFSLVGEPVFNSTLEHETFNSIEEYAASNSPKNANLSKVTVGTFDSDMHKVHGTYFGSRSSFHRTMQKDVVNHLELDMSLLHPLPYVQWMVDYVLPLTLLGEDKAVYRDFIENWGTHIVTKAAIGGICEQELSVSTCYVRGHADTLHNLASLHLASTTKQISNASFNDNWNEHVSASSVKMWGGDPTLVDWKDRQSTLLTAPVLVEVEQLVPIWEFFNHSIIQNNLKTVLDEYIQNETTRRQAQLKEIAKLRSYQVTATGQTHYDGVIWTVDLEDCDRQCYTHQNSNFQANVGHTHYKWCGHPGWTGTMPVQDYKEMTLKPTSNAAQSATLSSSYVYSNCETLGGHWSCENNNIPAPATSAKLTVTCEVDDQGRVSATNVTANDYIRGRLPQTPDSTTPGLATKNGCSKVTSVYKGGFFPPGPFYPGMYTHKGTLTFEGWCCVNTGNIVVNLQQMCIGPMVDPTGSCPSLQNAMKPPGYQT